MHALKPWLPLKLHDGWCGLRLKDYHDLLLPSVGQNRERERERKRERERESACSFTLISFSLSCGC